MSEHKYGALQEVFVTKLAWSWFKIIPPSCSVLFLDPYHRIEPNVDGGTKPVNYNP